MSKFRGGRRALPGITHLDHGFHGVENNINILLVTELLDSGIRNIEGAVVVRVNPIVGVLILATLKQRKRHKVVRSGVLN